MIATSEKPTVTARAVKNGAKENTLFVSAAIDGELWATNRYWLVPVERVAGLLWANNLPTDTPGSFTVNGRVTPDQREAPKIQTILDSARGAHIELTREALPNGQGLFVQDAVHGHMLALFVTADGERVALDSAYVDWITPRYCEIQLRAAKVGGAVSVFAVEKDTETFLGCIMPVRLSS